MPKSFRDKLYEKTETLFVNRKMELDIFRDFLRPENEKAVLFLTGVAGIGKSSLLSIFYRVAKEMQYSVALCSLSAADSPLGILQTWRNDLNYKNLSQFDDYLNKHKSLLLEASKEKVEWEDIGTEEQNQTSLLLHAEVIRQSEINITHSFVDEINSAVSDGTPPILMLDNYELASHDVDFWLSEDLLSNLDSRVRLVVSGRTYDVMNWLKWEPIKTDLRLSGLSADDVKNYIWKRGINKPEVADLIYKNSDGSPLFIALLTDYYQQSNNLDGIEDIQQETTKMIFERWINTQNLASPKMQKILFIAAYLEKFKYGQISSIFGEDIQKEFTLLQKSAFVKSTSDGYVFYHHLIREFLLNKLVNDQPELASEIKARLFTSRFSGDKLKIIDLLGKENTLAPSDMGVQLQILESDLEVLINILQKEEIIKRAGETEDGENLYTLSDFGKLVLKYRGD